jgi:pimeloyl-ACP methyl ester carboxylesterase
MKTKKLPLSLLFIFFMLLSIVSCKKDDVVASAGTIVLVHGSWAGEFVWKDIVAGLQTKNFKVVTVELPAHGADNTSANGLTLNSYRDKVVSVINAQPSKVILVGHSMGGMVISAVAESIADKIAKMVYLSAYLPKDGQALLDLANQDSESITGPNLEFSADFSTALIKSTVFVDAFCADCNATYKQLIGNNLKPEPLAPFQSKISLTSAKFGSIPKFYIETLQDKVIGNKLQKQMVKDNGTVSKVFSLDTSHSSYFTKQTDLINIIATLP